MMRAAFVVSVAHRRLRGVRAGGACCCAHVLRAERDRPSPFTSLRNKHHRPDPIHHLGPLKVDQQTRMQPGASGGGRSEVKEEGRVFSGPGDMSGVPHPMATARATAMSRLDA